MIVRLKGFPCFRTLSGVCLFQFYDSPIKSIESKITALEHCLRFNSMIVRLKVAASRLFSQIAICFNSMIVRLKEASDFQSDGFALVSIL